MWILLLLVLLVFKLHRLAYFAEMDGSVFGVERSTADVAGVVVWGEETHLEILLVFIA